MTTRDAEDHDTEAMGLWAHPGETKPMAARVSIALEWFVLICCIGAAVLWIVTIFGGWTEWLGPLVLG